MKIKFLKILFVLSLLISNDNLWGQAKVYFVQNGSGKMSRCDIDGSNVETLVSGLTNPDGAVISLSLGKVFWVEGGGKKPVKSANLDGSDVTILDTFNGTTNSISPRGITIDEENEMLYIIGASGFASCKLDGSNMKATMSMAIAGRQIAIDAPKNKMYWSSQGNKVSMADFDGSNIQIISDKLSGSWGIRFDKVNEKLYFTDNYGLYTSNPDGSSIDTLLKYPTSRSFSSVEIDPLNDRLAVTNGSSGILYYGKISTKSVTQILTGYSSMFDIAMGPASYRQAKNIVFSDIKDNEVTATWTNGSGTGRVAFLKTTKIGNPLLADGTEFTADAGFMNGEQLGSNSGWFCVYNGNGNSVTISNLDPETDYRLMVLEYSGSGANISYNNTKTVLNPNNVKTDFSSVGINNNTLPSSAVVCSGDFLDTVKGSTPTGGNPPYQYKWLVSTTGVFGVYGNAFGDNTKEWYIPGNINQTSWYKRIVTDGTISDTSEAFLVVVLKKPVKPEFLTYPSYDICVGTLYQNFAATTTPPANSTYKWSAVNAEIYSQGNTKQFALVNFKTAGTAKVIITADSAGCSNSVEKEFVVGPDTNHVPKVRYFNGDFICEFNGVEKYQWGYDTKLELGGYYLSGAINQNYFNNTTDTVHHYWVHSTKDGCTQKTYYNTPNSLSSNGLNKLVSTVYPNPSTGMFNVVFNQELGNNTKLRVLNIAGVTVLEKSISGVESQFSLENMPAGVYMVQIMNANAFVSTVKVVKQ